tara:strand:+ start:447 stop:773 length:327 start_codon:yes stop_codon:yes gene_type:complete
MNKNQLNENTQFFLDLTDEKNNDRNYNLGLWNLALSIRDLSLYSKGLRPHRHWRITPLKHYFGISGSAETMVETLKNIEKHIETKMMNVNRVTNSIKKMQIKAGKETE